MRFKMPETLEGLTLAQISELYAAARAEAAELNAIADDKITADESAALIELVGHLGTLTEAHDKLELEQGASAAALAAARAALVDEEVEAEEVEAEEVEETEEVVEEVEAEEAVLASAKSKKFGSFSAKVGSKTAPTERVADDGGVDEEKSRALSITAAANVPGYQSGQALDGYLDLAKAYAGRSRAFASTRSGRKGAKPISKSYGGTHLSSSAQRFSVAKLEKPVNEFTITEKMSAEDQFDLIKKAASEKRLGAGGLTASGGWCAPSEQIYGFLELESADGLLSVPEITARRSGITYTKGPQLGDLLLEANLGFIQTEAEAEAGDVKPVFDIECPDWDEARMDAIGYALRAGLLTDAAYPELLRRYLGLATIVHARRMNALTIQRISTLIGAATTFASVGATGYSATSDLLSSIELDAMRIREQYSMPLNSTVEGIYPLWVQMLIRADLSRRNGVELLSVPDSMINAWFTQRKVSPQFVRDYQGINAGAVTVAGGTAGWTRLPNRAEYFMYPAGSYVRLATDVIDLDTVYDTDDLTKNQFMAAFFEEGFGIANTGASGVKRVVNLDNVYGASGYPAIGALANVTPTP